MPVLLIGHVGGLKIFKLNPLTQDQTGALTLIQ
jgi:hypothetical protein